MGTKQPQNWHFVPIVLFVTGPLRPCGPRLRCPVFAAPVAAGLQKADRCPCSASAVSSAGRASASQSRKYGRPKPTSYVSLPRVRGRWHRTRKRTVTERAGSHACGGAVERSETERAKTEAPEQTKRASVHLDRGSCHLPLGMVFFCWVLSINGKRYAPLVRLCAVRGASLLSRPSGKEGWLMVTYSDLIQTGILIIGLIDLVLRLMEADRNKRQ